MYKKILVPYDMSMLSDKALEYAVKLSKVINNDKAEVILHVVAEIPMYPLISIRESSSEAPRVAQLVKHIEKVHEEAIKYIV
jgi:nucleotide-binding universal stress UspA family protein